MTRGDKTAQLQWPSVGDAKNSRGWQQLALPFPWGFSIPVPRVQAPLSSAPALKFLNLQNLLLLFFFF